jgi:hypothetical protein
MSKKIQISLEDPEIRSVWETVLRARQEVASWPAWMRGEDEDASPAAEPKVPTSTPIGKK